VTVRDGSPSLTLTDIILVNPSAQRVEVTPGETTVVVKDVSIPTSFALDDARPNPFNPSTTIAYEVPEQTHITLTVYNMLGQEVVTLMDQVQAAGRYEVVWNGTNTRGAGVASGIYLYRIVSGSGYVDTKRMTLLK
jgi:flagellar hook assembly protein FlgD